MSSTTDPTVPLPTATDTDDDDDDDDVSSSLLPSQPPAATPPPQPTVAPAPAPSSNPAVPGVSSAPPAPTTAPSPAPGNPAGSATTSIPSSATRLSDSLPSSSSTLAPAPGSTDSSGSGGGLSTGASAGIGVGVALLVCLAAFGTWFFLRRRKSRRNKTRLASSLGSDEENGPKPPKTEVYAYRSGGPAEVSGDEKPRRWSELESPTYVAEVGDGQVFRAELPGSAVPVAAAGKRTDERLFADAPIDEVDEPNDVQERAVDKKKDERLFSDPPIDERTGGLEAGWSSMDKKG